MEFSFMNKIDELKLDNMLNSYRTRQIILFIADMCSIIVAFLVAMYAVNMDVNKELVAVPLLVYLVANIGCLIICKGYSRLWHDSADKEILSITVATIASLGLIMISNNFLQYQFTILFYLLTTLLILFFTTTSRVLYRSARRIVLHMNIKKEQDCSRVLVIGGGSAGSLIIRELYENAQLGKVPVGIIDDDKNKQGKKIQSVPIIGTCDDIKKIAEEYEIDEIIFSIANILPNRKQEIIRICKGTKCKLKKIPGIYEIIDGKVDIKKIKDVDIEDLLGRDTVDINLAEISGYLQNKTILVTGGGGSIGSELCRQISKFSPKKLILLDIYENGAYDVQQELVRKYEKLNLEVIIGSVRDEKRLDSIFNEFKPDVVFHAAAHKHVPLMEASPCEAIKNNVFGTIKVATMAHKYNVNKFVLISTDKAVNPTNIMGATKRCAEMVIQAFGNHSKTEFVAVRFGNVLGSNGSVIPLFKKQIAEGGPVTVTHEDVTRYFMTIPEAVSLVMQAGAMAKGGEIFVLNMGDSVKIIDLAKNLISLSGFVPYEEIDIQISGLRPGEKLYEELLMEEEGLKKTQHNKIFIGKQIDIDYEKLETHLGVLKKVIEDEKTELVDPIMKELVPTFVREENTNEQVKITV